jgi:predicted ATP-binding protein involved in virulence
MRVEWLSITHFRGLHRAEYSFHPNMNLFIGENGSGKTSVIECLRVMLSQIAPDLTPAPRFNLGFNLSDIMHGKEKMMSEMSFSCHGNDFYYLVHKQREKYITTRSPSGEDETTTAKEVAELSPVNFDRSIRNLPHQPILLFFSTRRSIISEEKSKTASEQKNAYYRSMHVERGLRIKDFADWWRTKIALSDETGNRKHLAQIDLAVTAVSQILPEVTNWRLDEEGNIWVDKARDLVFDSDARTETYSLTIDQLSDGERSLIVLAFDITRRLIQANSDSDNPVIEGNGVVLIDEIDLHLHPKWQRRVIDDLRRIFPNIQFIVSSHSPFIIQSLADGHLHKLDGNIDAPYINKSIDDVAEDIMGVEIPERSMKHVELMKIANQYYRRLHEAESDPKVDVSELKKELDVMALRYSNDPFVAANFDFKWETFLAKKGVVRK